MEESEPEECMVLDDDEEEHINTDDHHKTNGQLRSQVEVKKRGGLEAYNKVDTVRNNGGGFHHQS